MLRSQRLFGDNAAMTPAATSTRMWYLDAMRPAMLRADLYQSQPSCTSCDVASVNLATISRALTLNWAYVISSCWILRSWLCIQSSESFLFVKYQLICLLISDWLSDLINKWIAWLLWLHIASDLATTQPLSYKYVEIKIKLQVGDSMIPSSIFNRLRLMMENTLSL